jgi:hypothetical protein
LYTNWLYAAIADAMSSVFVALPKNSVLT